MFKYGGTIIFGFSLVVILIYIVFVINPLDIQHGSPEITADVVDVEQDLSKLLSTGLTPKIVKCNFTGTYQVTQDYVYSRNGAKCNDFESRTLTYNNVITACSGFLDSRQELLISCISTDNPVLKCDGIIKVHVDGMEACEYWVFIKKVD